MEVGIGGNQRGDRAGIGGYGLRLVELDAARLILENGRMLVFGKDCEIEGGTGAFVRLVAGSCVHDRTR